MAKGNVFLSEAGAAEGKQQRDSAETQDAQESIGDEANHMWIVLPHQLLKL